MTFSSPATSAAAGLERRMADRRHLRVQAQVVLPGQQRFGVRTLDIGPGGLAIVAPANPKPGTTFELEFALPDRQRGPIPMKLPVRVIHSVFSAGEDGFKIGLSFARALPAEATQAIQAFLK